MPEAGPPRRAVRQAFDRAAARYDAAAGVQREIGARLEALMRRHPAAAPRRLLDAGCGTGDGLGRLAAAHPDATRIALDFAPAMLASLAPAAAALRVCADIEALPLADGAVDGVWSSLALQWCEPQRALRELARVTAARGMAWLATLAPDTLHELRAAFAAVDDDEHVLRFRPPEHWRVAAETAGWRCLELRRERTQVLGAGLRDILAHLRGIGAHRVAERPRRQLGRGDWCALERAYERHRRDDGLLPATYDVVLLALRRD